MGFFDDAAKKVEDVADEAKGKVGESGLDVNKEDISNMADDLLEKADAVAKLIPGETDDKLIDQAEKWKNDIESKLK